VLLLMLFVHKHLLQLLHLLMRLLLDPLLHSLEHRPGFLIGHVPGASARWI